MTCRLMCLDEWSQLSNEKTPGCLGYVRDFPTQVYKDYDKPLQGSHQDLYLTTSILERFACFFRGSGGTDLCSESLGR